MDDNKFKGRPDGNGSGAGSGWAERVSLPDHLRPPLPASRSSDEPVAAEEEEFALPVAEPDGEIPDTAASDGILPDPEEVDSAQPRTTPPDTVPVPEPEGAFDLDDPALYLNRELTWLNFNYRVLAEAADSRVPLLERLKFLAIVSSNLDEFFMKRIGGLKQQVGAGLAELSEDGRTPQQQIDECYTVVRDLEARKRDVFLEVASALAGHDIVIAGYDDLNEEDQEWVRRHYVENIYP
ncbi:MAG: hypothetical protein KJO06_10965, partial [Gemmatimonadetes bacterium]|nr:hypothetical protein [Gemmatimonadota bacterium]